MYVSNIRKATETSYADKQTSHFKNRNVSTWNALGVVVTGEDTNI